MKKKYLITTLGLSFVLGLGLVAGLGNVKQTAASAEGEEVELTNVYLELGETWGSANAYYTIHYWGGESVGSTWPGATFNVEPVKGAGTVLTAKWDARATHVIISRYGDAEHETRWNYWDWFDTNEFTVGQYNYFVNTAWDSCNSSSVFTTILHVGDETVTGYAKKGEVYNPYTPKVDGKYFAGWYVDATKTTPYSPSQPAGTIELYAKMLDFEYTGWIAVKGYNWSKHQLYVWEGINGTTYYHRGAYGSDTTNMWKADNVLFNNNDLFVCKFKYHDASEVKFIYTDGTDANKSATTNFNPGIDGKGCYYKFDSEVAGQLVADEKLGLAASFVYDLVCKLTVTEYETAYGARDYSICALTADQKALITAAYNELRTDEQIKTVIDAAELRTYVYGESGDFSEYGNVSFAEILNQIAGYDIVNNSSDPARNGLYPANGTTVTVILVATFTVLSSIAFIALRKKFAK